MLGAAILGDVHRLPGLLGPTQEMKTLPSCREAQGAEARAVLVKGHSVDLGDTSENRLPSSAPGGLKSTRTCWLGLEGAVGGTGSCQDLLYLLHKQEP